MTSTEKAKLDPLTHTLNISTFQKLTKRKIKQKNKKHALIIMDLNDFKQINDNYGHPIGDAVIIEASNRLNRVITGNDSLSRMGGDEFVILLCDVENEEQVRKIARRIVASIQKPMSFDNLVINVAISVGYALYPIEGETYDLLYQVADERMYNCKHKNKNNIPCFEK
jgi:diguanylate cyclase (GGDEF)-like protein